ncbi:hypothetical protein AMECASPLE_038956 [Ameca splendens]|uniref:Uncharacterized protein n=1 Tax=Ameca splendens TaxID=208324 RepID=A0ABV0YJJ4_9TELE
MALGGTRTVPKLVLVRLTARLTNQRCLMSSTGTYLFQRHSTVFKESRVVTKWEKKMEANLKCFISTFPPRQRYCCI